MFLFCEDDRDSVFNITCAGECLPTGFLKQGIKVLVAFVDFRGATDS